MIPRIAFVSQRSNRFALVFILIWCRPSSLYSFQPLSLSSRRSDTGSSTRLQEQLQPSQQQFGFIQLPPDDAIVATRTSSSTTSSSLSAFAIDKYADGIGQQTDEDIQVANVQQRTIQKDKILDAFKETVVPILSASLLITSNTVGAGCLVLPEIAHQGPGMLASVGIFTSAYVINLVSGLAIAQIAINQKEQSGTDTPSSFKEFARVNLNSDAAAVVVSSISLFVNACVLTFDLNRVGTIGSNVLQGVSPELLSMGWAAGVFALISTQSSQKLSQISNFLVAALFISFGGLLLPGLANVADPMSTFTTPGLSDDLWGSIAYAAPIMLMSMIFQNIVPTVTKLLNYDRFKTVASLVVGSSIPLVLYLSWIFACLGGGIDTSAVLGGGDSAGETTIMTILLTIFSFVTIGGSSMCGGVSIAEELESLFPKQLDKLTTTKATASALLVDGETMLTSKPSAETMGDTNGAFQAPSAFVSLAVPLVAALAFAGGADGEGLTGALALAGSFGSPLLYGAIPAYMAYQQLNQRSEDRKTPNSASTGTRLGSVPPCAGANNLIPAASLPILGALSTGYVGQEMFQRINEMLSFAI